MGSKCTTDIDELIAKRVRMLRLRVGLSQADLGAKLGVTLQQIRKYELGINRIGAGRLFEMASIFNVPVQILFPDPDEALKKMADQSEEPNTETAFGMSADGWRLSRVFLKIEDSELRKGIISLVEKIAAK